MITIEIRKSGNDYTGFSCRGHAGYAEEGYDIICAAVSVLTTNAVNSIERFTEDAFKGEAKDGLIRWKFTEVPISKEAALLMDSLVLGLEDIQKAYGKQYLRISQVHEKNLKKQQKKLDLQEGC